MKDVRMALATALLVTALAGLWACQHAPKGEWFVATGRARVVDDLGQSRPRVEAAAEAKREAQLKILRHVESMAVPEGGLVGDYMTQDALFGAQVRSLILSARLFDTRYRDDGVVEVDMGIDLGELRRIVGRAGR